MIVDSSVEEQPLKNKGMSPLAKIFALILLGIVYFSNILLLQPSRMASQEGLFMGSLLSIADSISLRYLGTVMGNISAEFLPKLTPF